MGKAGLAFLGTCRLKTIIKCRLTAKERKLNFLELHNFFAYKDAKNDETKCTYLSKST